MFTDKQTTARRLVEEFREFFVSIGGAPVKLWSDNSLFPSAEFQDFLRDWNVAWGSSSPHFPQSKGRAEVGIKSIKSLVTGSRTGGKFDKNKMAKALLLYRNAPRLGLQSPAQLVFNRPIRDGLPAHRRSYAPEWQNNAREIEAKSLKAQEKSAAYYNQNAKDLKELSVGDHVLIQNPDSKRWITPGIVVEVGPHRDYLIKTGAGRVFRRNRRMLRKRTAVMPGPGPPLDNPPPAPLTTTPTVPLTTIPTGQPEERTNTETPQARPTVTGRSRGRGRPIATRQSTRIGIPSTRYPDEVWIK